MKLYDRHDIAAGDPARLRQTAARMSDMCEEIAGVAAQLRRVSTQGVWDSGAGEIFAARVGEVPGRLDAVRARVQAAANLLPPYAGLLADAQDRMRQQDGRYARAREVMHECDQRLETLPPEAPERAQLMARRAEAAGASDAAQQAFVRESEEILADEQRLTARLSSLCTELADPAGYDALEGLSNFGTGPIVNNPITAGVRVARLAAFAHPIGELGHLLVYDEGSAADVAAAAKTALLSIIGTPKGAGAQADEALRRSVRSRQLASRNPAVTPPSQSGGTVARLREKARAGIERAVAQAPLRVKYAAHDQFESATGIRMITNMTSDWAALGTSAGPMKKATHVAAYTLASAKKVDTSMAKFKATGETIKPHVRPSSGDDQAAPSGQPASCRVGGR